MTRGEASLLIRPRARDAVTVCEGERQELLRPCRQRDNERDGVNPPRSHAVGPDVRPQHRTRWRHFRLKHSYTTYPPSNLWILIRNSSAPRKAGVSYGFGLARSCGLLGTHQPAFASRRSGFSGESESPDRSWCNAILFTNPGFGWTGSHLAGVTVHCATCQERSSWRP